MQRDILQSSHKTKAGKDYSNPAFLLPFEHIIKG